MTSPPLRPRHPVGVLAGLAVMIVPTGLALVAVAQTVLIQHLAVHLCRWPATVSCDVGVPIVWWGLTAGLWGVVATATADAARFVVAPDSSARSRLLAWAAWGPAVVATTWIGMQDRTLHREDLLAGTVLVLWALALVAHSVWSRQLLPKPALIAILSGLAMAAVFIPAWAPAAFRSADRAAPAHESEARRRASEKCLENQARRRSSDRSPDEALLACEIFPEPG